VLLIGGCSGTSVVPDGTATQTAAATAAPTVEPTISLATLTPSQAAVEPSCVISTPQQVGTDLTPVAIAYDGLTEAQCADLLVVKADASEFAKANPPTRLGAEPTDAPVCSNTVNGITLTVWGAAAAHVACSAIGP
jgi:hypothetical protein